MQRTPLPPAESQGANNLPRSNRERTSLEEARWAAFVIQLGEIYHNYTFYVSGEIIDPGKSRSLWWDDQVGLKAIRRGRKQPNQIFSVRLWPHC